MKKLFCFIIFSILMCFNCSFAKDNTDTDTMVSDIEMQRKIDNIGFRILNANKIDKRMIFVYQKKDKKIKGDSGLTKRQIVVYKDMIQFAQDDSEIAAMLAPSVCRVAESYTGPWRGLVSAVQVRFASKKYEILFDKRAVDFLVSAGYNPIAVITFMNKANPQKRFDFISSHNLTSKRLANVYEYIYINYPQFLARNEYLHNESYQNFLLTSIDNRKKLQEKILTKSEEKIKYE